MIGVFGLCIPFDLDGSMAGLVFHFIFHLRRELLLNGAPRYGMFEAGRSVWYVSYWKNEHFSFCIHIPLGKSFSLRCTNNLRMFEMSSEGAGRKGRGSHWPANKYMVQKGRCVANCLLWNEENAFHSTFSRSKEDYLLLGLGKYGKKMRYNEVFQKNYRILSKFDFESFFIFDDIIRYLSELLVSVSTTPFF